MKATRMSVMADLIRRNGWTRGAELGVWKGDLFGYLLAAFPKLHLIGVDHWRPIGPYTGKNMEAAEAIVRKIVEAHPGRAQILREDTVLASLGIPDGSLDFVFIDASHDTASVCGDIGAWRPRIRPGGALTGHDANWPSVQAALDELLPGWQLLGGNVWIYTCA
jgi:predicted O-methyltransferase YrrM